MWWKALGRALAFGTIWVIFATVALALVEAGTGYDLKAAHPWLYAFVVNGPSGIFTMQAVARVASRQT